MQLRKEVGFGCPVPECGSPYLYYHHFAPPWNVVQHHNPAGMIALCSEHHSKADAGAFTNAQLAEFKESGKIRSEKVKGRFDWMRREILLVAGTTFSIRTPILVQIAGRPVIWLNRDDEGYLLLNVNMPSLSAEGRICLVDNMWEAQGNPTDLECPPSGRTLGVSYANDDFLRIAFTDLNNVSEATQRYPDSGIEFFDLPFPICAAEVEMRIAGTGIEFGPRHTRIGGAVFTNNFMSGGSVGFSIG